MDVHRTKEARFAGQYAKHLEYRRQAEAWRVHRRAYERDIDALRLELRNERSAVLARY